ncbi:thiamine-phosphate kinase [Sphingomonas swuensis]|uniref:Thiamine-monophosphate kinase n=1 Tax=Sphingomonas swuensis TaxID=977800 RepID=A0ABP7S7N5_9SPHN
MTSEASLLDQLRTLATNPAARGLADDVALLGDLVLTHDTVVEGVHYLPSDPPESVGWKLGAVNLSDLAAKGAAPVGALLSLSIGHDPGWEERFLAGLAQLCEHYRLPLLGGDTVALPAGAPRVLGLTAIGRAAAAVPSRSGGRPGDRLWLVGTVGDSAAGLACLLADRAATGLLVDIYRRPIPLLDLGASFAPHATATMDVSDGLLLDSWRLARASGCGLHLDLASLPLSSAFVAERGQDRAARLFAATGGDDYALLVALPPAVDGLTLWQGEPVRITPVGELVDNGVFTLVDDLGPVPLPERLGYEHHPS